MKKEKINIENIINSNKKFKVLTDTNIKNSIKNLQVKEKAILKRVLSSLEHMKEYNTYLSPDSNFNIVRFVDKEKDSNFIVYKEGLFSIIIDTLVLTVFIDVYKHNKDKSISMFYPILDIESLVKV